MLDLKTWDRDRHIHLVGHGQRADARVCTSSRTAAPSCLDPVCAGALAHRRSGRHRRRRRLLRPELGVVERVDVLPFHQMGRSKWQRLGLEYTLDHAQPPTVEVVERACDLFRQSRAESLLSSPARAPIPSHSRPRRPFPAPRASRGSGILPHCSVSALPISAQTDCGSFLDFGRARSSRRCPRDRLEARRKVLISQAVVTGSTPADPRAVGISQAMTVVGPEESHGPFSGNFLLGAPRTRHDCRCEAALRPRRARRFHNLRNRPADARSGSAAHDVADCGQEVAAGPTRSGATGRCTMDGGGLPNGVRPLPLPTGWRRTAVRSRRRGWPASKSAPRSRAGSSAIPVPPLRRCRRR